MPNYYRRGTVDLDAAGGSSGAAVRVTGAAQGIPDAVSTVVAFDAEEIDRNGFFDVAVSNTRLVVPAGLGGIYVVGWRLQWDTTGNGTRQGFVRINGTVFEGADLGPGSTVIGVSNTTSTLVTLAVGDYVELLAYQNSGAPLNLSDTGHSPMLWMTKVA